MVHLKVNTPDSASPRLSLRDEVRMNPSSEGEKVKSIVGVRKCISERFKMAIW